MFKVEGLTRPSAIGVGASNSYPGLAAGSRIQCRRGELLVETLDEGEEVLTASGRWARITEISHRTLSTSVRIERDAFGSGQPYRAMSVGPEQIIAVEGRLAEARTFLGDTTVRAETPGRCRFYVISLDRPGFAIVDGIAAELPHAAGPTPLAPSRPRRDRLRSLAPV